MTEHNSGPCCGGRHGRDGNHEGRMKNFRSTEDYKAMDADSKLIMNLRDLGHVIRFLFEGKGSQKRILILLYETGGMTQRELTEKLGVQPGSASEVIGKLESSGLILRMPSQADRRTADIRLTESGQIRAEEAAKQRKTRHQEMFSCLSEDERDTLLALAERLNADWDSRYRENNKGCGPFGNPEGRHGSHGNHRSHGPGDERLYH